MNKTEQACSYSALLAKNVTVGEALLPAGHRAGSCRASPAPSGTAEPPRTPGEGLGGQGRGPPSPGPSQRVRRTDAGDPVREGMKAAASYSNPAWTIL